MEKPNETKPQQQTGVAVQEDPKSHGHLPGLVQQSAATPKQPAPKERKPHFTCTVIKPTETTFVDSTSGDAPPPPPSTTTDGTSGGTTTGDGA